MALDEQNLIHATTKQQFADGAGTPNTLDACVVGFDSLRFNPFRNRRITVSGTQCGTANRIHGVLNHGVSIDVSTVGVQWLFVDPANAADATPHKILLAMWRNDITLLPTLTTSTNSLPANDQIMLDMNLITAGYPASGTTLTGAMGAVFLLTNPDVTFTDGGAIYSPEFALVEEPAWTAA